MEEDDGGLDLVEDNFDDCSINDAPLEDASEAGSFYEVDYEEDIQRSVDSQHGNDKYRSGRNNLRSGRNIEQMPTISEERNESRANTTMRTQVPTTSEKDVFDDFKSNGNNLSSHEDNSNDFSIRSGAGYINQYTDDFFAKENRADALFPENVRALGMKKFEKENSWEPSICVYEKQPSPLVGDNAQESPHLVFSKLDNVDSNQSGKRKTLRELNTQKAPTPEKTFMSVSSPQYVETKTSTPKRDVRSGRAMMPVPLDLTSVSSIHANSPIRGNTTTRYSRMDVSGTSNATVNSSMLNLVPLQTNNPAQYFEQLEKLRKNRMKTTMKPNFRETAILQQTKRNGELHQQVYPKHQDQINNLSTSTKISTAISDTSYSRDDSSKFKMPEPTSTMKERNRGMMVKNMSTIAEGRESVNSNRPSSRASTHSQADATSKVSRTKERLKLGFKRLAFGNVEIGDSLTIEMEIENPTDKSIRIESQLETTNPSLFIPNNTPVVIGAGKKTSIRVTFRPKDLGRYITLLNIINTRSQLKQQVPVWGYGGVAKIQPVIGGDLQLSGSNEWIISSSNFTNLSFNLNNAGKKDGFAFLSVYDSNMKPVQCKITPSSRICLRRKEEREIVISLDDTLPSFHDSRASSVMSSVSTRKCTPADLTIQVLWGEENTRQRLKLYEKKFNEHVLVDDHDLTRTKFSGEVAYQPREGEPEAGIEDKLVFDASYRVTNVLVYLMRNSRQFSSFRSVNSYDPSQTTMVETTAFRCQTFVRDNDATIRK